MAKLTKQHKVYLVQCLAEFHSPSEAADALRLKHGVEVSPQAAEHYDPNKWAGRNLAKDLRDEFIRHRKAYLKDTKAHVPIANKTVRLQLMAKSAKHFERTGNHLGLMRVLEQAAKEMGGSYTNLRQFTGKDGGPIKSESTQTVVHEMSQEQVTAELRALGYDPDPESPESPTIQ